MVEIGSARLGRAAMAGAMVVMISACGGASPLASPGASPSQSATAPAAVATAAAPTATIAPSVPPSTSSPGPVALAELAAMSLAVVAVAELNLRAKASASAKLLEPFLVTTPLPKGTRVLVLDGPVKADGYRWYLVGLPGENGAAVGWVAAGASDDSWLRPDQTACQNADVASITSIAALSPIERIACFGSRSLTFVARQVTAPEDAGFGGACEIEPGQPEFLVCAGYDFVQADGDPEAALLLHFDPQIGIEPTGLADPGTTGPLWQIRGHFMDAASPACASGKDPESLEYRELWLGCATRFVVEALEPAA